MEAININVIRYTYQDVITYFSSWMLFNCLRICRYVLSNNIIKIFPEGKAQDRLLIRAESRILLEQVHLYYRYYNHDHSHVFGRDHHCFGRNHPHTNLLTLHLNKNEIHNLYQTTLLVLMLTAVRKISPVDIDFN